MRIVKFVAPLVNFRCDCTPLALSQSCRIRRVSDVERKRLRRIRELFGRAIDIGESALELDASTNLTESEEGWDEERARLLEQAKHAALRAVTILRLYREEKAGFNAVIQVVSDPRAPYVVSFWGHFKFWAPSRKYSITAAESGALAAFYADIDDCSFDAAQVAVDWFNKTYIEPYVPRDALLDAMIALDSLYVDDAQELGYKLATRMAAVLGEPREVFDHVRKAYGLRGRIVHSRKPPTDDEMNAVLPHIMGYLRRSLILFLKNPGLKEELDDIVLGVAKPPGIGGERSIQAGDGNDPP